jgi:hypothetical protein
MSDKLAVVQFELKLYELRIDLGQVRIVFMLRALDLEI